MSFAILHNYIAAAPTDPLAGWRWDELVAQAKSAPPDDVIARHAPVIKADAYSLWLRWFMEGICSPLRYIGRAVPATEIDVYVDVLLRIDEKYPGEPKDERELMAQAMASRLFREVVRQRELKRVGASASDKQDLIDRATGTPRCWLCGFAFSEQATDRFLRHRTGVSVPQPSLVDVLRPRGITERDVTIEVEHMVPVAVGGGGSDNLAMACGWCNKSKGARTSLYDVDGRSPRTEYILGGQQWHELPHPFWTVRILATRGRCEDPSGCLATAKTDELFIVPADHRGSPNPSNLHIRCGAHDPYAVDRLIDRFRAKAIWNARRRAWG